MTGFVCATLLLLGADPAMLASEFIYETAPFPSCHASTIVETKAGLVTAWFGGTAEGRNDVGIWLSRHVDGKWTEPVEVARGSDGDKRYPCWNPVLFQPSQGPLLLFYKVGPSPSRWWGVLKTSEDHGRTWSEAQRLPDDILGPVKNKPIELASGEILAGSSTEHAGWRVHFERLAKDGRTGTVVKPAAQEPEVDAIQPSILKHADGRLQAIGRTRRSSKLFSTWSKDEGQTWSALTLLDLPNPNSGTDALTLADGRHLLVYNHTPKGRSPLNIALSNDGETWTSALVLEDQPGEYSYPAVIQTADGKVHVTYTWKRQKIKHMTLDPARLK
jgi:predicted neuraminidase